MNVAENVQMALISHAAEIYRFWPAAASLHHERALDLLEQVGESNYLAQQIRGED